MYTLAEPKPLPFSAPDESDWPATHRMSGWRETAAQVLARSGPMPIENARYLVECMFNVIEDVQYLVLVDVHDVPGDMFQYSIDDDVFDWNGRRKVSE